MFGVLCFLSLLGVGLTVKGWEPCGKPPGCYCTVPILHQIQCLNVSRVPAFEEHIKPGVLTFTFFKSPISEIGNFSKEEWSRLNLLNFADTNNLSCKAIAAVERPGLHIYSYCINWCSRPKTVEPRYPLKARRVNVLAPDLTTLGGISMCAVASGYLVYSKHRPRNDIERNSDEIA